MTALGIWLSVGVWPPSFNQVPVVQWENEVKPEWCVSTWMWCWSSNADYAG